MLDASDRTALSTLAVWLGLAVVVVLVLGLTLGVAAGIGVRLFGWLAG